VVIKPRALLLGGLVVLALGGFGSAVITTFQGLGGDSSAVTVGARVDDGWNLTDPVEVSEGSGSPSAPSTSPTALPSSLPPTKGPSSRPAKPSSTRPGSPPVATASSTVTTGTESVDEFAVVVLTNIERVKAGCAPLVVNDALVTAARGHSEDMVANNYFAHRGFDGRSVVDRAVAAGYVGQSGAENIAAGQTTPDAVVQEWMASPGHRANITDCHMTEVGVGLARGGSYGTYWTQDFGTPPRP
jgi:uncharacterized protein YkwD